MAPPLEDALWEDFPFPAGVALAEEEDGRPFEEEADLEDFLLDGGGPAARTVLCFDTS